MESLSPSSQSSSQPSSSSSPSILPPLITNPNPTRARSTSSNSRRRKKKMKTQTQQSQNPNPNPNPNPNSTTIKSSSWKSESTQQVYTSKLLQAFRHLRLSNPNPNPNPNSAPRRRGRLVKEAADRVLATAARGRTRWSRAILSGHLRRLKFTHKKLTRRRIPTIAGDPRRNSSPEILKLKVKTKDIPAVQRKAKVLGKLVPGCRKESFPVVLEEAVDYIPALEMQVRTLRQILALFSGETENSGDVSGDNSGEGTSSGLISPENGSG